MLLETAPTRSATRRRGHPVSLAIGAFALVAIAFVAVIDLLWGLTHENYSYVSDTISDLAAGTNSWTMDLALTLYAVAIAAVAFGLWLWAPGRNTESWRWTLGCLVVLAIAPIVYVIAAHDAYGDGESGGFVIHHYLVYALAAAFPLAAWLLGPGFDAVSVRWRNLSLVLAVLWVLTAPWFMMMGTGWDGLYERGLALMLLVWFGTAAWMLLRRGRGEA